MTYSSDLRQKVLEKLEQGYSIRQTAKLFGIHFTTVR
ncbi:helix-turn-helix domain-containing protein, partial [Conchiformibius steedae]